VKAECIYDFLKESDFIDVQMKREIYADAKHLSRNNKRKKILELRSQQRDILTKAAAKCRSDPTYAGLFDEILGINSSQVVFQHDWCLSKYVMENEFVNLNGVNLNPMRLDTTSIDCSSVIVSRKEENERQLIRAFQTIGFSPDAIGCILEKYRLEQIFGKNMAKDVIVRSNMRDDVKKSEDWKISKSLSDFSKVSLNCLYIFN